MMLLDCLTSIQKEVVDDCTSEIVNGGESPTSETFARFAKTLGVPVEVMRVLHRANCADDRKYAASVPNAASVEDQLFDE